MQCASCGFESPPGFRFCGSCGHPLAQSCPSCGADVPAGFRFCGACGNAVDAQPGPEGAARVGAATGAGRPTDTAAPGAALPSERRRVTVLFADLVGFSTLAEQMDPEELRALMGDVFSELTAEVEAREGTVEKFIGDAVVALFGVPRTHEDDPERAVETALGMLQVVERRSQQTPAPLQLRIGINSGLVVSGSVGDGRQAGVMGDAVNAAARLQQGAAPGELVVAASVWRRVRGRYRGERIGELEVKGREQLIEAYRIAGRAPESGRRQAPFVGRREEAALLELLWSSAVKGNTHVVSVVGEPGVGKSRLLAELPVRDEALDVRIVCSGERPFGPILELIARVLGDLPEDADELRRRTSTIGLDEASALVLAPLLGLATGGPAVLRMASQDQQRQVFAAVWQFLLATARQQPMLVVLDDLHWADRSSLELLAFLLERLGGVGLMLVLSYRPGFEQVERAALRSSHTGIRLEPLSAQESVDLARGFLGVEELPADLERVVATRAEGNPFFVEELLQALLELGSLAVVDGSAVLTSAQVEIPDTVQGTIQARADRLDPAARSVLQHAAVIGRTFSTDLLEAVIGHNHLVGSLEELAHAQLLVAHGPEEWGFKHALIQEVSYETLLLRQRREMHRKVAEALEARVGNDPALLELVADHYGRAQVPDKARGYAVAAGDLALERMGFEDARSRYEAALRLWGEGDQEGRLELLMKLGRAASLSGDVAASRTALIEAEAGWRALGNSRRAGLAAAELGRVYWQAGEADRAKEVLRASIAGLEPFGASPELVRAFIWLSSVLMLDGNVDEAEVVARRGLEMAEHLGLDAARSHLLNTLSVCRVERGDPGALDGLREALELAERSGEAEAIGRAYINLASSLSVEGYNREAVDVCRRGGAVLRRLGAPGYAEFISSNEAEALVPLGRYEEAEEICRELLGSRRAALAVVGIVNSMAQLTQSLVPRGRYAEARQTLDEMLPMARGIGGAEYLAPALAVEAELEHARGNHAAARQAAAEALSVVLPTPSVQHLARIAPTAAELLAPEEAEKIAQRLRTAAGHRSVAPRLAEVEARISGDAARWREAAALYAAIEAPYDEARCRLEAGEIVGAREIISRLGVGDGPLGMRLRGLEAQPAPAS